MSCPLYDLTFYGKQIKSPALMLFQYFYVVVAVTNSCQFISMILRSFCYVTTVKYCNEFHFSLNSDIVDFD